MDLWPKSAITELDTKYHEDLIVWINDFENMAVLNFCHLVRTDHWIRKDHASIEPEEVAIQALVKMLK
ncbi:hypothetical protein ATB54_12315 [Xanthomonas translucens]|nr:hypothetical protein ATB54_12315 [Xanthomonas translucens]